MHFCNLISRPRDVEEEKWPDFRHLQMHLIVVSGVFNRFDSTPKTRAKMAITRPLYSHDGYNVDYNTYGQ